MEEGMATWDTAYWRSLTETIVGVTTFRSGTPHERTGLTSGAKGQVQIAGRRGSVVLSNRYPPVEAIVAGFTNANTLSVEFYLGFLSSSTACVLWLIGK